MNPASSLSRPRLRSLAFCLILALLLAFGSGGAPTRVPPGSPTPGETRLPAATGSRAPISKTATLPAPTLTLTSSFRVRESDLAGQVVVFWYVLPERIRLEGEEDPFAAAARQFNRDNAYGIDVETAAFPTEDALYAAIEAALSGEPPSLVALGSPYLARLDESARLVLDLSPYLNDASWGLSSTEINNFEPAFLDQDLLAGKRLGLPLYRSVQLLVYNRTWAGELGYDEPPQSALDLKAQACAAADFNAHDENQNNFHTGGWLVNNGVETTASWLHAFKTRIAAEGEYDLDTSRALQTMAFLRGLYSANCSWVNGASSPAVEFANRSALFISASITALPEIEDALRSAGSRDEWGVLPYPGNPGQFAVDVHGPALSILKSSPYEQMAAWMFARSLLSTDSQAALVESLGVLPAIPADAAALQDYRAGHPHWAEAAGLVEYARSVPALPSWPVARWALHDAAFELYRPSFKDEMLNRLVDLLATTLAELDDQK